MHKAKYVFIAFFFFSIKMVFAYVVFSADEQCEARGNEKANMGHSGQVLVV